MHTGMVLNTLDRLLYLETMRDISDVFRERELGFSVYRRVTVLMLVAGTVIMHLIASWLTKPIRLLTRGTKRMAAGDYDYRARQISNDELGQLTKDFNDMANALEENMARLEEEIQDRENFVAAFAHELKTPLTAIIGYADMLRSHKLDEEKVLCLPTIFIRKERGWKRWHSGCWILLLRKGRRRNSRKFPQSPYSCI